MLLAACLEPPVPMCCRRIVRWNGTRLNVDGIPSNVAIDRNRIGTGDQSDATEIHQLDVESFSISVPNATPPAEFQRETSLGIAGEGFSLGKLLLRNSDKQKTPKRQGIPSRRFL